MPAEIWILACPSRCDMISDGRISVVRGCEKGGFCPRDEGQHSVPCRRHLARRQPAVWLGGLGGVHRSGGQDPEDDILPAWCGSVCPELGASWPGADIGGSGRNSVPARCAGEDMGEDVLC